MILIIVMILIHKENISTFGCRVAIGIRMVFRMAMLFKNVSKNGTKEEKTFWSKRTGLVRWFYDYAKVVSLWRNSCITSMGKEDSKGSILWDDLGH